MRPYIDTFEATHACRVFPDDAFVQLSQEVGALLLKYLYAAGWPREVRPHPAGHACRYLRAPEALGSVQFRLPTCAHNDQGIRPVACAACPLAALRFHRRVRDFGGVVEYRNFAQTQCTLLSSEDRPVHSLPPASGWRGGR